MADDVVEAAVVADEFEHAGGEEGDDDEFAHAGHALSHGTNPVHEGAWGADEGDGSCGEEAEDEDFHDVHAAEGGAEDEEVGEDFEPLGFLGDGDGCEFPAQDDVEQEDEECGREDDGKVGLEFVLHGAALGAGGGDGGVGDEGEVIAEEGAADDTSGHEGERGACFICQSDGDGHEGDDGADGCADGEGDDAGGEEDAGKYHVGGEKGEGEVDSGIDRTDVFGRLGEGSGKDENPDHHHDVAMGCASGEAFDAFAEAARAADDEGPGAGGHEGDGDGHFVEVACHDGGGEVEQEEDEQGTEYPEPPRVAGAGDFGFGVRVHGVSRCGCCCRRV